MMLTAPPPPFDFPSDDMGFGDVGFTAQLAQQPGAGGKAWTANPPHTPNLDAWASANSTLVFDRFYSGSAVCSPTRSSCLTGRTPNRECIFSAEGCGTMPAYSCNAPLPLPPVCPPRVLAVEGNSGQL